MARLKHADAMVLIRMNERDKLANALTAERDAKSAEVEQFREQRNDWIEECRRMAAKRDKLANALKFELGIGKLRDEYRDVLAKRVDEAIAERDKARRGCQRLREMLAEARAQRDEALADASQSDARVDYMRVVEGLRRWVPAVPPELEGPSGDEGQGEPFGDETDPADSESLRRLRGIIDDRIGWKNQKEEDEGGYEQRLLQVAAELRELRELADAAVDARTRQLQDHSYSDYADACSRFNRSVDALIAAREKAGT